MLIHMIRVGVAVEGRLSHFLGTWWPFIGTLAPSSPVVDSWLSSDHCWWLKINLLQNLSSRSSS